jgi:hypothetical protein
MIEHLHLLTPLLRLGRGVFFLQQYDKIMVIVFLKQKRNLRCLKIIGCY